jgi:hypothetical protein
MHARRNLFSTYNECRSWFKTISLGTKVYEEILEKYTKPKASPKDFVRWANDVCNSKYVWRKIKFQENGYSGTCRQVDSDKICISL